MFSFLLTHTPILYLIQSLWRDEAFSILVAEKPISFFFGKLTFEPPLYYAILHFWIKLFGESEIATRSLSFIAFALATIVVIVWAEKLFQKHWLSWFLPIFFFFNPMLLYYAFEVRTYGLYIFFATLMMYAYTEKKWRLFVLSSVLGFYNHTFFLLLPLSAGVHYLVSNRNRLSPASFFKDKMVFAFILVALLISPWLFVILQTLGKLTTSWYYPVDFQLIRSVLGNLFLGFEGTPGHLWPYTFLVSVLLLFCFIFALKEKPRRSRNLFFFISVFVPLVLVVGISFIKPIYVNRYLIFVTIAEIFLIAFAIEAIKNKFLQSAVAVTAVISVIAFSVWFAPFHKKVNMRGTFAEINAAKTSKDVIFAKSPLVLFESMYYSTNRKDVYLYNPGSTAFPWYVGDIIVSSAQMATVFPLYPSRAFLVDENGSFTVVYQTNLIAKPKK